MSVSHRVHYLFNNNVNHVPVFGFVHAKHVNGNIVYVYLHSIPQTARLLHHMQLLYTCENFVHNVMCISFCIRIEQ